MTRKKIYEHLTYIQKYDTDGEKIYYNDTMEVVFKIKENKIYDLDGIMRYEIKGNHIYEPNSTKIIFDIR